MVSEVLLRPSSWPIRQERRHVADIRAKYELSAKLDATMERLDRMGARNVPPGLGYPRHQEVLEAVRSIDAKVNALLDGFQSSQKYAMELITKLMHDVECKNEFFEVVSRDVAVQVSHAPSGGRQLRVGLSDASTAALSDDASCHLGDAILQPIEAS